MPPSMLADESERDLSPVWTWRDRLVVQGFDAYEASLCDGCRQNRDRSFNPHMSGHFQIHPHTCYGCEALENARKNQKDSPGMKNYVVDAGPDDLPPHRVVVEAIDEDLYAELTES